MTDELTGSAWLVTGAAGYVGSHVAHQLHESGAFVIGLDNFSTSNELPSLIKDFNIVQGDILDEKTLEK
ncbi:MAG: NAD-dependent epimerase/dehydratase family protein, partial [Actinomycetes bacterium]